jgi:hypothetical protein
MNRTLRFTDTAKAQFIALQKNSRRGLAQQVKTILGYLETDPKHPSLKTHEFTSLKGEQGEKVFEAYVQNKTPGAYRIFWNDGPDVMIKNERRAVITIIAMTPHP